MTRLVLVEDDDGDAFLVEELLRDSGESFAIERARSIAEAIPLVDDTDCTVIDLGLPDAHGLSALTTLRKWSRSSIVVLTGLADRERGIAALTEGAQDYLVKGEVDGDGLARAIRYAIERFRADEATKRLLVTDQRHAENARLARGLLPQLDITGGVTASTRYWPGADALLGGDFFDALMLPDGRIRAVIGDVCGHGPAEAAVGVALRIAWRTCTIAGLAPADVLATVERVLVLERDQTKPFATLVDVTIDPAARTLELRRHGHPPPLIVAPHVLWTDDRSPAPPLGCFDHVDAEPTTVALPPGWSLLLLTDGIYEGRADDGRLGLTGLAGLVAGLPVEPGPALLDALIAQARVLHGGDLADDVALLLLSSDGS